MGLSLQQAEPGQTVIPHGPDRNLDIPATTAT